VTAAREWYHHGDLRAALLKEAERTVSKKGSGGLSLRELARATGVSHSAPRPHFRTKQALLDALAVRGWQRLDRHLNAAIGSLEGTFTERLTAFAQVYVRFAARNLALQDIMNESLHRPDADPEVREAARQALQSSAEMIADAISEGELVVDDLDRAATAITAVIHGLVKIVTGPLLVAAGSTIRRGDKPPDVVVSETIETLVNGLRPRNGRPPPKRVHHDARAVEGRT
jgi:AcrR family transcriptional regulator